MGLKLSCVKSVLRKDKERASALNFNPCVLSHRVRWSVWLTVIVDARRDAAMVMLPH